MHLDVGPHRFSLTDARRALLHASDFLDAYPDAVHPHQTERRRRIGEAVAGLDIDRADVEAIAGPLGVVWPLLLGARDDSVASSSLPAPAEGTVEHLHTSDGGVPKRRVERVEVDFSGVVGDRQATRQHHGSPFQALCLWNTESIDELAAQGHPIEPGFAGENVTVSGLDWPSVQPGVRLRIGGVVCDVSGHAVPCSQNAAWFSDRDFRRIHHDRGPWSRMYATVLEPGAIEVGDVVALEACD